MDVGSRLRGVVQAAFGRAVVATLAGLALSLPVLGPAPAQAQVAPPPAGKFEAPFAVLEALLFPPGQEQVVRFDETVVGQGRALVSTVWDPPGPKTAESQPIRTLLGGDFVQAGTGFAKGRPANLVQLYVASLAPFTGRPELVLKTAFDGPSAQGEVLMVVERPDCIVVASHRQGRISRMASVTLADALNFVRGESEYGDAVNARVADCRTRTAAAAVGAWGVFELPGAAAVQSDGWLPPAGPSASLFESEVAEILPKIEPGLSRRRFVELTASAR